MASMTRAVTGALIAGVLACLPTTPLSAQAPAAKPAKPSCLVSEVADRNAPTSTTFPAGLDESKRKRIFVELSKAVEQARREAVRDYPNRASSSLSISSPTDGKGSRYTEAQRLAIRTAEAKNVAGVTRAHTLVCEDARGVYREGQTRKWPIS